MLNYLFKNLNTLFLTCALAFISIANAQEVRVIDNKGTIKKILIPTRAELFDTNGGFEITDDIVIIPFNAANTATEIDDPDHYGYSLIPASITIKKPGTYKVTYRVTAEITSGTNRSGTEYILLKNNVVVPGSYSAAYHRTLAVSKDTASASRILVLGEDDELSVRGNKYIGNSTVKTVAQGSSFLVERIKLTPE